MAKSHVPTLTATPKSFIQQVRTHIELADPVTWITPIAMVLCGALAAGQGDPGFSFRDGGDLLRVALVALMCGPLGTGFSQSINDYFDRHLDAINDPSRPIPSQRISLAAARVNWIGLGGATALVALFLVPANPWIIVLAILSLLLSAAYSIPPVKLKQHYWFGPPAVGFGYVFLSWNAGHLTFAPMTWPSFTLAIISSAMAAGLLFLNDIKSIEGDRKHGLQSMTVALGPHRTLLVSYLIIAVCEILLLIFALLAGHVWAVVVVVLALVIPVVTQVRLYQNPTHKNFQRYIVASNPFVVLLQVISALIIGGYVG